MDYQEPKLPQSQDTDIRSISGLVQSSLETPTGRPRTFFQQFRIVSGALYYYDAVLNAWFGTGAGGGTPAGADTQIQFNNSGSFGADQDLVWAGALYINHLGDARLRIDTDDDGVNINNAGDGDKRLQVFTNDGLGIDAGPVNIYAGAGTSGGAAGSVNITGGDDGVNGGGDVRIAGGAASVSGLQGNVVLGRSVVTTDNGGFLQIPTCAGTPTGTPASGALVLDTTARKLWHYNGSNWKSVAFT